jgi:hypothetical protein
VTEPEVSLGTWRWEGAREQWQGCAPFEGCELRRDRVGGPGGGDTAKEDRAPTWFSFTQYTNRPSSDAVTNEGLGVTAVLAGEGERDSSPVEDSSYAETPLPSKSPRMCPCGVV